MTHTLTAVARDTAGHTTTSAVVAVVVSNAASRAPASGSPTASTKAAGRSPMDSSGNNRSASLSGTAWSTVGRYGGSLSFNGTSAEADPPNLGTFYKTGFTYEAWARKQSTRGDAAIPRLVDERRRRWPDAVGRPYRQPLPADPRQQPEQLPRLGTRPHPRPVAADRCNLRRARRRASTSTACRPRPRSSPAMSEMRTTGASERTARLRRASSTG